MLTSVKQNTTKLSLDKALNRMYTYAEKSKPSFAHALKIKAPTTHGRLAGPAKA